MLNFGVSKPRVKGGRAPGAPLDPRLRLDPFVFKKEQHVKYASWVQLN